MQTAIAAAINLRCFAILAKRADGVIGVDLPDIGLVKEFTIKTLPWDAVVGTRSSAPNVVPKELDQGAILALERYLGEDGLKKSAHVAALAILYLYMVMSSDGYRSVMEEIGGAMAYSPLLLLQTRHQLLRQVSAPHRCRSRVFSLIFCLCCCGPAAFAQSNLSVKIQ